MKELYLIIGGIIFFTAAFFIEEIFIKLFPPGPLFPPRSPKKQKDLQE